MVQSLILQSKIKRKMLVAVFLFTISISILLYSNVVKGDFVYDDYFFSSRAAYLSKPSSLSEIWGQTYVYPNKFSGVYRPLVIFTFALNFIIFGENTVSFHLVNIFLNGIITFLVFLLVYKVFGTLSLAFFSSLIFAFLPIHPEAVSFIKSRDDLLSSLFAILAWLVFMKGTDKPRIRHMHIFYSSLLYLLAVLSKETIFIVPLLFVIFYSIKKGLGFNNIFRFGVSFMLPPLVYLGVRYKILGQYAFGQDNSFFVVNPLNGSDIYTRVYTAFKIAYLYIIKIFVPYNLSANYHYNQFTLVNNRFKSAEALMGVGLIAVLIFFIFNKKYRNSVWGLGSLIFMIPYLMFSKLVFNGGEIIGERWMYFPSIGAAIIYGHVISRIWDYNRKLSAIIIIIVLSAYTYIIIPRNNVWGSKWALYESMLVSAPRSAQSHFLKATAIYKDWRNRPIKSSSSIDEGLEWEKGDLNMIEEEIAIAEAIYPYHPPLLLLKGMIAYWQKNYQLSEKYIWRSIKIFPKVNQAHFYFGMSLFKQGQYLRSLKYISKLNEFTPNDPRFQYVMALNYYRLGDLEAAQKYYQDFDPDIPEDEMVYLLQDFREENNQIRR